MGRRMLGISFEEVEDIFHGEFTNATLAALDGLVG